MGNHTQIVALHVVYERQRMTSTCSGCGEGISDVTLNAFGMTWHPYHLVCRGCGKDFSDGKQPKEGEDGYAYCDPCFVTAFSTVCATCNQVIEGEVINAMDKAFHPDHFTCEICKSDLTSAFFPGKNGLPLCEKHYYESEGRLCNECERPIIVGKCVKFAGKSYHLEHFNCKLCKKHLGDGNYKNHEDKPYCKGCHI